MVNLTENRPDSTGLARADLSTMTAPPGKRICEAYVGDWIAKTRAAVAKMKEDEMPLSQMPGLRLKGKRPGLR